MWTTRVGVGLVVVASSLVAGVGCTSPAETHETQEASTSKLSACQLVGAATTASVTVAVASATATGTCAETAAAATVVSGGVAAAGGLVCLAPAGAAAVSTLVAILGAGVTMLVCGDQQSQVSAATSSDTPASTDDTPAATDADGDATKATTCSDDVYAQLKAAKAQACNSLPSSCTNFSGSGAMTSSFCVGLQLRQSEYQKCLSARQDVINQCFGGVPTDQPHQDQLDTMQREVDACQQQLDASCNGSANQPTGDDPQDPDGSDPSGQH